MIRWVGERSHYSKRFADVIIKWASFFTGYNDHQENVSSLSCSSCENASCPPAGNRQIQRERESCIENIFRTKSSDDKAWTFLDTSFKHTHAFSLPQTSLWPHPAQNPAKRWKLFTKSNQFRFSYCLVRRLPATYALTWRTLVLPKHRTVHSDRAVRDCAEMKM